MERIEGGSQLDVTAWQQVLRDFANARDWDQFHSPKNLVMALAAECGELLEVFQWITEEHSRRLIGEERERATEELADILIYVLRVADVLGISLPEAVAAKVDSNAAKYPVDESKGNATKYSKRRSN